MLSRCIAYTLQAALPPALFAGIGHLSALPKSQWTWFEYLTGVALTGFIAVVSALAVCKTISMLHRSFSEPRCPTPDVPRGTIK
jgi:hypothetical protein